MTNSMSMALSALPLEIHWDDDVESLVVTPRDAPRFEIQKERAIEALRLGNEREMFVKQLNLIKARLFDWLRACDGSIADAYLTIQDSAFAFVVVRKESQYNAEFEDALSDLDFEIANDPALESIKLNAIALPPVSDDALASFVEPGFFLKFPIAHGHGE